MNLMCGIYMLLKAYMKRCKLHKTTAIYCSSEPLSIKDICSVYVIVDFICKGLLELGFTPVER